MTESGHAIHPSGPIRMQLDFPDLAKLRNGGGPTVKQSRKVLEKTKNQKPTAKDQKVSCLTDLTIGKTPSRNGFQSGEEHGGV